MAREKDLLAERVALVTGSGAGIGRAIARAFAAEGAAVVIASLGRGMATQGETFA